MHDIYVQKYYTAQYPVHMTVQRTLYFTPSDLFIPTPTCILWEGFSLNAITEQRLFVRISASVCGEKLINKTAQNTSKRVQIQILSIESPVF